MRKIPDLLECPRTTGAWERVQDRDVWTGEHTADRIPCGYETDEPKALVCHLIATHRIPLDQARATVDALRVNAKTGAA